MRIGRYLLTRCAYCGGRFSWGYAPVEIPGYTRDTLKWWQGEPDMVHYETCAPIALLVVKFRQVCGPEVVSVRRERTMARYYGSYPWWRECILGESPAEAKRNAKLHVQRSIADCEVCHGDKEIVVGGTPREGAPGPPFLRDDIEWVIGPCEACDGSGHPLVEDPVPNELVLEAV